MDAENPAKVKRFAQKTGHDFPLVLADASVEKQLGEPKALPTTRIVMLTVSQSERDVLEAMRRGASGYLTKDLSRTALLQAVRDATDDSIAILPRSMARSLASWAWASATLVSG